MRPNINDIQKFQELKRVLAEKNVSANAISTVERALNKGMVFKKPEDLALLNIPTLDFNIIGEVIDFGSRTVIVKNLKRIEYTFKPIGEEKFFFGYQLIVTYISKGSFTIEQSYPIEDTRVVIVDLDLNDLLDNSKVSLHVKSAKGMRARLALSAGNNAPKEEIIEVNISALANATINVGVDALAQLPNPSIKNSYQIKGKLISNRSEAKLDGYQVVIYAATTNLADDTPDFSPVAFARTETNGYFVTGFLIFNNPDDINNVKAGKVNITKDGFKEDFPIKLIKTGDPIKKSMLPERLIIVINEDIETEEGCKDCGCSDLNFHEKKVLEEYSYYTVVRTTEPSIIADVLEDEKEIDLDDLYGIKIKVPFSVFQKFHAIESKQIKPLNFFTPSLTTPPSMDIINTTSVPIYSAGNIIPPNAPLTRTIGTAPALEKSKPAFNKDLLDKLLVEHKIKTIIKGNEKPVFKGRTHLNQLNQIDWDDEPTIYQAASIAHGHLLHFKQEWIPDGYSIGDLVYSLPLAPGQKKQIAVLDWERRESAANSQFLGYEETLNNSLVRDRDINEVVSATLTENIRGNSKASTGGIGFGFGSSVMGIIPGVGSFGSLLGISGGKSSSGSTASQNSNRESTANSLQSITDRTMQAASVVRSQRSTVVQTVSQGERVQATAESVANYNHCHAITIQYFEVLRHFTVRNRIAGVQECLFVPLQMTPFDLEKCLRWRNTLEKHLYRQGLRSAFEAVARIQNEKESAFENYYDSIGFPRKNFAEQNINFYSGDLFMEFFFFNTKEAKIDDEIILFFNFFGISLDGFRDKKITDEELANHVGPRAIEYLLDAFTIETDKGVDLKLDLTLITTFRQNANLRISVRQAGNTPVNIARNQVDAINVKLDLNKLSEAESKNLKQFQNKFMKIRVRSGNLLYRTENFSGMLFNGRLDNDIFAEGDGVFIPTPLTRDELRNPRGEDVDAANNLLHHLNENLEYYHKCLFFDMTPERRFMLLDGIIAPGKANGRSVASVVENRVIGIAGNSLIMPVAPGNQLDPTIDETFDLFAQYYHDEHEPMRISMPTKGIYAEAVMGKCNSCEEKDESRFWRWEESPIPDSPNTQILPLNTDTRREDPGNLQPKDFPVPVVNIQNAPNIPDPTGLQGLLQLIGKGDSFRDLTGLNQNQLNALATFQKTMDTAQSFGKEAAELAKAAGSMKLVEDAKKSGSISNEDAKASAKKVIDNSQPKSVAEKLDDLKQISNQVDDLVNKGLLSSDQAEKILADGLSSISGSNVNSTDSSLVRGAMEGLKDGKNVKAKTSDVKTGQSTEIEVGAADSSILNRSFIIDDKIIPDLRAFRPSTNDKTGIVKLSVRVPKLPEGGSVRWFIPPQIPGNTGTYTITPINKPEKVFDVEIKGITPGNADIDVEVLDSDNKVIESQKYRLNIPQFVRIAQNVAKFDAALTTYSILHLKENLIRRIKIGSESILQNCNVRMIWTIPPFSETVPGHVPANRITTATFLDRVLAVNANIGNVGITFNPGSDVFNETIEMYPLGFTDPSGSSDVDDETNKIVKLMASQISSDPLIENFVLEVMSRLFAESMSHEIIHSLLGDKVAPMSGGNAPFHNEPSIADDIMNAGSSRSFTQRTGFERLPLAPIVNPIAESDFTDFTITAIGGLQRKNSDIMRSVFPVSPGKI